MDASADLIDVVSVEAMLSKFNTTIILNGTKFFWV